MRKKYLSALLFGALLVASTGTFTSCKDYDDEIAGLQNDVDADKALISTLESQIKELNTALQQAKADAQAAQEAAAAAQDAAKKADENAKLAAAQAKEEAIAAAIEEVNKLKAEIQDAGYATVEDLNKRLSEISTSISAIETGLNNKINSLAERVDGIEIKVSAAESAIAQINIQLAAVEKLAGENKEAIDALKTALETAKTDLLAKIKENADNLQALDNEVKGLISALEKKIGEVNVNLITLLGESLRSLVFIPNLYVNGIEAAEYGFLYATTKPKDDVKQTGTTPVDPTNSANFTIDGTFSEGVSHDFIPTGGKASIYNPVVNVEYHMNPSSAKVDKDNLSFIDRDVEVISRVGSKVTYAGSEYTPDPKDGVLSVGLKADGMSILSGEEEIQGDGKNDATIFALQAKVNVNGNDTVITSDYAMLYATKITPLAIAYTKESGITTEKSDFSNENEGVNCPGLEKTVDDNLELYVKPKHAASKTVPEGLNLKYNSEEGLNLKEMLCIHYAWDTKTGNTTGDKHRVMTLEDAEDYGMSVEFNMVNFLVGDNNTSDSKFLDPNKIKEGQAVACIVKPNSDGTGTSVPGEQGVSSIGRHPLVQVLVRDANNNVLLDGYIKLEIVQEIKNKVCTHSDFVANFGCDGDVLTQNWDEVSYNLFQIAAVTSKEEFDAIYELDLVDGSDKAKQYVLNGAADEFKPLVATAYIGDVKLKGNQTPGTTTQVLEWTLGECDMESAYHSTADADRFDGTADNAKTIYVRYKRKNTNDDASNSRYVGIYVPLTVHIAKPNASIGDRIPEYWFNDMINWYEETFGVHGNVDQPNDNKNTKDFIVKLNAAWKGNKIDIKGVNNTDFPSYADTYTEELTNAGAVEGGGYMYYFRPEINGKTIVGVDGKVYTLSVDNMYPVKKCGDEILNKDLTPEVEKDYALKGKAGVYANTKLYASAPGVAKTQIAEIFNGTIEVADLTNQYNKDNIEALENQPVLKVINNDVTKQILNTYAHDDERSLTALIGITAMSSCDVTLSLTDNVYPIRIQRPVDIEAPKDGVFTDAEANGSIVDLFDLFEYSDWRNVPFVEGDNISNAWLFAYYGFKSAKADIENITTTLGGYDLEDNKLLSEVSTEVRFDQIDEKEMTFTNVTAANYSAIYNKVRESFGKIRYDNNNNNVKEFKVRIPVVFTYEWGTIKVYVDCDVKNTLGN